MTVFAVCCRPQCHVVVLLLKKVTRIMKTQIRGDERVRETPKCPEAAEMQPVKLRFHERYDVCRSATSSGRSRKHTWKRWRSYAGWMLLRRRRRGRRYRRRPKKITLMFHRFGIISHSFFFYAGHGHQRAHRIPRSHPAGEKPEA